MSYDAVVVGSGPNGLAAAITLAQAGCSVLVLEAKATMGGGMRSLALTEPGFVHDICSAIHPLGVASPFFRGLPLARYGLEWIHPELPLAHPLDDGTAVPLARGIGATADALGADGDAYRRLMTPLAAEWDKILDGFLGPLRPKKLLLDHPIAMTRFGLRALWPAQALAQRTFHDERSHALFAGLAAHSILALDKPGTAAFGLMLGLLGHAVGWPLPRGGSQRIADALTRHLQACGGDLVAGWSVQSLAALPPARAVLLDVTPRQFVQMADAAGYDLPALYRTQLARYRYGPGVFKIDWALHEPIPWTAAACRRAGTVHVGGTLAEIAAAEKQTYHGRHVVRPYVLAAQQSLFDDSRAPADQHTAWAYCHVPHGSTRDMTDIIERQIERFAPGFGDCILARHTHNTAQMQRYNPNYIGGDINGGVQDLRQLFNRPALRLDPYATPLSGVFLCSSATPPGGGVHGMCGYHAAQSVLRTVFGVDAS